MGVGPERKYLSAPSPTLLYPRSMASWSSPQLSKPEKVSIPERYVDLDPEEPPSLEELQARYRKAEKIRSILTRSRSASRCLPAPSRGVSVDWVWARPARVHVSPSPLARAGWLALSASPAPHRGAGLGHLGCPETGPPLCPVTLAHVGGGATHGRDVDSTGAPALGPVYPPADPQAEPGTLFPQPP